MALKTKNLKPVFQQYLASLQPKTSFLSTSKRFNFDTYKLVRQLERNGFTRGQSVGMMRTINAFLVDSTISLRLELMSAADLENDSYSAKAHLQDVRNELSSLRQNDSLNLKGDTDAILRDIENLEFRFTDLLIQLKNDISMDLNLHKAESKELTTEVDLKIQEINHKLIIRMAELKTNVETMKVELTTNIVWYTVGSIVGLIFLDWVTKDGFKKSAPSSSLNGNSLQNSNS